MKWFKNHTFRKVVAETNIFDVGIGFAVAGVFVKLVNSLVVNVITPPIGALIGGKNLANFEISIPMIPGKEPVLIRYGLFLDVVFEFVLVVIVVYWAARALLRIKKSGVAYANDTKKCAVCCMKIPRKAQKCPYCQSSPSH